jgi:hypothetical protein
MDDDDTVLTINGEPVSIAEYLHIMSGERANVFSYFSQKYGAKDSGDFWTSSFNGEVPVNKLKQNTIDKLKKIKTEQSLMKLYGITDDISYPCFLEDLRKENERRRVAVSKNLPIYGPIQYDENIYFEYLHSERTEKLKHILSGKELFISEADIKKYYDQNKEIIFRKPDNLSGKKITSPDSNNIEKIGTKKGEKEAKVFGAYEEVRGQIKDELINLRYEEMIRKLAGEAIVNLNEKALRKISLY